MLRKVVAVAIVFCLAAGSTLKAQDKMIDEIVAVVGSNIIMKSDIEKMYQDYQAQGITSDGDVKCEILEELLIEKLLVAEAELDTTITVSDSQINQNLEQRMQYFIKNLGSEKNVEAYFKKPIVEIKAQLQDVVKNQLLTNQMRQKIISTVTITPAEVRYNVRNSKPDDLPLIRPQVEYGQISVIPPISIEEENQIKARLRDYKKRIEEGANFATLAVLYSECPSAPNGGELGYMGRAQLDPAYAAVAFNLRGDRVSNVVKSDFGYHIIQLIDRRGEQANTRHILLKPKPSAKAMEDAKSRLDSLASGIRRNVISFDDAAMRFSSDKNSRNGGGVAINPANMSAKWAKEELDPDVSKVLDKMKENEISEPFQSLDDKQRTVFKVVKLISRTKEHRANMQDDYQQLADTYLHKKQDQALEKWISERQSKTYIRISDSYANCNFKYKNWIK